MFSWFFPPGTPTKSVPVFSPTLRRRPMPDKKNLTRTFAAELRTLPVELVPPDPSGTPAPHKPKTGADRQIQPGLPVPEESRGVLDRLINRIKHI
jgi:hypothetical protein